MKRIVITGGAGRLGRAAIADLVQRGYDVTAVDVAAADDVGCPFQQVDLVDREAVVNLLHGAEWLLHLGAVPGPNVAAGHETFRNNVLSTYNVVEGAAECGLARVVCASSLFAVGWADEADRYWPRYVPLDEQHPLTPFEAYGLSKLVGEEICAAVSRRTGLPTISLRITNVIQPDKWGELPWPAPTRDNPLRFMLWPYVALDDAAAACRLALEAETNGHEAFFIAARDIRFDRPTRDLLREFAPQVDIRGDLPGTASVLSIAKAARLLGFAPQWNWPA